MTQLRPLSPKEAFDSRRHELVRLPDCALPDILGRELADTPKVTKDLQLVVRDADIPNRIHRFSAVITDQHGRKIALIRGERYLVHISPFGDNIAYVSKPDGSFLGIAPGMQAACRNDIEAIQHLLGIQRQALSVELKNVAPFGAARLAERFEDTEHNLNVMRAAHLEHQESRSLIADAETARRADFVPENLVDDIDPREFPDDDPVPSEFAPADLL